MKFKYITSCHDVKGSILTSTCWAIKNINFNFDRARTERKYDLNELEAYRNESYECLQHAREKRKFYHDKHILRRKFKLGEKVLLYDFKIHIFLGKLRSR